MKTNGHKPERLLSVKEIAAELGRCQAYVYRMQLRGFQMDGRRAYLSDALTWLGKNPPPFSKEPKE